MLCGFKLRQRWNEIKTPDRYSKQNAQAKESSFGHSVSPSVEKSAALRYTKTFQQPALEEYIFEVSNEKGKKRQDGDGFYGKKCRKGYPNGIGQFGREAPNPFCRRSTTGTACT